MSSLKDLKASRPLPAVTQDIPQFSRTHDPATPFGSTVRSEAAPPATPPPAATPPPPVTPRSAQRPITSPPARNLAAETLLDGSFDRVLYDNQPAAPLMQPQPSAAVDRVIAASAPAAAYARHPLEPSSSQPGTRPRSEHATRTLVDVLWYADNACKRLRTHPAWQSVAQSTAQASEWITDGDAQVAEAAERDGGGLARALSRIPIASAEQIARSLHTALDDDGVFRRPVLVTGGMLSMGFDPIESLAAMVSAARPFAGDKKLAEPLEEAERATEPGTRVLPAAIEVIRARLLRGFSAAAKSMPADYLDSAAERALLEEHRYASLVLFGARHHCATLVPVGGTPIPTYFPEQAAAQLPLMRSFEVRLLVEPHAQQDPNESAAIALSVLAIARATRLPP